MIHEATDGQSGQQHRIPLRQIVTGTLNRTVHGKATFTCIDVHAERGLVGTASGKICHIWEAATWKLLFQLGRASGSVHKEAVRFCTFSPNGEVLASCGDDHRVVVWSTSDGKAIKVLLGHRDVVFRCKFSHDGALLYTCAADGMLIAWLWTEGKAAQQPLRHASAVRDFDISIEHDRVSCACNDGTVCVWERNLNRSLDTIDPDALWDPLTSAPTLEAWADRARRHTGSICCVSFSPNGRLMVTASNDCTCKLWDVISYMKDVDNVVADANEEQLVEDYLGGPVNLADEHETNPDIDIYAMTNESKAVPISTGFHADLLFTYRHESPCLTTQFSSDSRIVVTGSLDCTCKLWSTSNGYLLFQINTPAPISHLTFRDKAQELMCCCGERILVFSIKIHRDHGTLPTYWQKQQDSPVFVFDEGGMMEMYERPQSADEAADSSRVLNSESKANKSASVNTECPNLGMNRSDITRALAQGIVAPSFFPSMVSQYTGIIDIPTLFANMNTYKLDPRTILRLLARSHYSPVEILKHISSPTDAESFINTIKTGHNIAKFMDKPPPLPGHSDEDIQPIIFVKESNFTRKPKELIERALKEQRHLAATERKEKNYHVSANVKDTKEDIKKGRPLRAPKYGRVMRFKPTEQLRFINSVRLSGYMDRTNMQRICGVNSDGCAIPNFGVHAPTLQTIQPVPQIQKQGHVQSEMGVRFNDSKYKPRTLDLKRKQKPGFGVHSSLRKGALHQKEQHIRTTENNSRYTQVTAKGLLSRLQKGGDQQRNTFHEGNENSRKGLDTKEHITSITAATAAKHEKNGDETLLQPSQTKSKRSTTVNTPITDSDVVEDDNDTAVLNLTENLDDVKIANAAEADNNTKTPNTSLGKDGYEEERADLPVRGICIDFPETPFDSTDPGYGLVEKSIAVEPIVIHESEEGAIATIVSESSKEVHEEQATEVEDDRIA